MSKLENPITPTIGRIVLVRGSSVLPGNPVREVPAIVTRVWGQNCIDVTIFKSGQDGVMQMTSVMFNNDTEENELAAWRWMDYQVQQAAKESQAPHSVRDRVQIEADELRKKTLTLGNFRKTDLFQDLPEEHRGLLEAQLVAMMTYLGILDRRLALMPEGA